jgi:uncharacterized protein (DUF58 family)
MIKSRLYLSRRTFSLLALIIAIGSFSLFFEVVLLFSIALFVLLILLIFLDLKFLAGRDNFKLSAKISKAPTLGQQIELLVILNIVKGLKSSGVLFCIAPKVTRIKFNKELVPFIFKDGVLKAHHIGQGDKLGFEQIKEVAVICHSRWSLWLRRIEFHSDVNGEFVKYRVMPDIRLLPEHEMAKLVKLSRNLSQSRKVLVRSQEADQFHSIRPFRYPDSTRHIDHKKSARLGQLMTRTYDAYRSHHLIIVMDVGRTMVGQLDKSTKQDYYISVALSLAESGITVGDKVSLVAVSNKVIWSTTGATNLSAFEPLFKGDKKFVPDDVETSYDHLPAVLSQIDSKRSIVLFFTELGVPSVQAAAIRSLQAIGKKHAVLALSLLHQNHALDYQVLQALKDSQKVSEEEYKRLLYLYWADQEFALFSRKVSRFGIAAALIPERYWLDGCRKAYQLLRNSLAA